MPAPQSQSPLSLSAILSTVPFAVDGGARPGGRSPAHGHDGDGDRHLRALS